MTLPGRPTHHAPSVSLSSFKSCCLAAGAAASLLISVLPASALSVNIVEDSSTRLAFDVVWGMTPSPPDMDSREVEGRHRISGYELPPFSIEISVSSLSHVVGLHDMVHIYFHFDSSAFDPDRRFSLADVDGFSGSQILALSDESYGARLVYGTRFPDDSPIGVPDNCTSVLLLSAGLVGLTLLRRTVV